MNALEILTIASKENITGKCYPFDGTWEEVSLAIKKWNNNL